MTNLPDEIIDKILLDAMQLRNLRLCEEVRRNIAVVQLAERDYGRANSRIFEFLSAAEECYVAGAPRPCRFQSHVDWLRSYEKWQTEHSDFEYRQVWPTVKSSSLIPMG